ncbi:MAG: phage tail sheath family protein [Chthoniobacterales bacterium]|nr:phage tail sheath family protein [Chthoniobacterales bacterium]
MPVLTTYPGVYIEEIPSGVRTITGVATSITAFIGRALRGPTDLAVTVNSFGDFERTFGGLWEFSPLSFAVRDFYQNGGAQAVIVRLFNPSYLTDTDQADALDAAQDVAAAANTAASQPGADAASVRDAAIAAAALPANAAEPRLFAADAVASAAAAAALLPGADAASVNAATTLAANSAAPVIHAHLAVDTLTLEAASPGAWGNQLRARIDHDVLPAADPNLFNLTVRDGTTGKIETFRNVSVVANDIRNLVRVLEQESALVRVAGALPAGRPNHNAPNPLGVVPPGGDPFDATFSSGVSGPATDGLELEVANYSGSQLDKTGIHALDDVDLFNLLCIPPISSAVDIDPSLIGQAAQYCEARRAMLLIDAPASWNSVASAIGNGTTTGVAALGTNSKNAAVFFPRFIQPNPTHDDQTETFAPCGAVAGVFARTDAQRGVWKAPAGLETSFVGVPQLTMRLTDAETGQLNPLGINCLRTMPAAGRIIWGARTLQGDDRLASEWKYIPVRRTALFLEESLYRGTQWVVFEPNDEPLWAQIRLNLGAFMQSLFRQGAFQGKTPKEAYLVKCDSETTTQDDINRGVVNILVGFAPLKPAEFVIIRIQQLAGQIDT